MTSLEMALSAAQTLEDAALRCKWEKKYFGRISVPTQKRLENAYLLRQMVVDYTTFKMGLSNVCS